MYRNKLTRKAAERRYYLKYRAAIKKKASDRHARDRTAINAARRARYVIKHPPKAKPAESWYSRNKEHVLMTSQLRYRRDPTKAAANQRKALYNLTTQEYETLLKQQDYKCLLCCEILISGRATHIDHLHGTKTVRGVLCRSCNLALGQIERRSPEWLTRALEYLGRFR
jgi:hypothetical protein